MESSVRFPEIDATDLLEMRENKEKNVQICSVSIIRTLGECESTAVGFEFWQ